MWILHHYMVFRNYSSIAAADNLIMFVPLKTAVIIHFNVNVQGRKQGDHALGVSEPPENIQLNLYLLSALRSSVESLNSSGLSAQLLGLADQEGLHLQKRAVCLLGGLQVTIPWMLTFPLSNRGEAGKTNATKWTNHHPTCSYISGCNSDYSVAHQQA